MLGKTNVKIKPNKKINFVDFIQSSGTQYIDTGVIAKTGLRIVCEFELTSYKGTDTDSIFGVWGNNSRFFVGADKSKHNFQYGYIGNYYGSTKKCELNTKYTVEYEAKSGSQKLIVDGATLLTGTNTSSISTTQTIFLFNFNSTNTSQTPSALKIYSCQIYDNDILIRDYKPVVDGAGAYCLYEEIEKRYYYNRGTGEFIGGVAT